MRVINLIKRYQEFMLNQLRLELDQLRDKFLALELKKEVLTEEYKKIKNIEPKTVYEAQNQIAFGLYILKQMEELENQIEELEKQLEKLEEKMKKIKAENKAVSLYQEYLIKALKKSEIEKENRLANEIFNNKLINM